MAGADALSEGEQSVLTLHQATLFQLVEDEQARLAREDR
jgi:hypothetical protein